MRGLQLTCSDDFVWKVAWNMARRSKLFLFPPHPHFLSLSLSCKKNYKKRVRYKKAYQKSIGWCYYTELSVEPEVHGQFDPWTKRITDATQNFDIKPTGQKKIWSHDLWTTAITL
jgi:hypothetical protein